MRLVDMLSQDGAARSQEESKTVAPQTNIEAYTFTDFSNNANSCRFFRFDETTAVTVSETTLLTLAAETEKNLSQLKEGSGVGYSTSADGAPATEPPE